MPPPRYKVGDNVAGWHLRELLGSGGNGEVWRAERESLLPAALRILRQTRADSEPYKRFATEVRVLQEPRRNPGILPLLDVRLPAHPSRSDPTWLSMPIAIPLRDALPAEAPLLAAVQAIHLIHSIHSISATLAELTATRGLNHRDIKPEKLYQYEGHWCIGDFGLVEDPTGESLTEVGQLLGAKHNLAPELHSSTNASWASADLYALAKTLWVLITGQKYPPPGHLVRDVDYFRLSAHIESNEALRHLERLIERSTDPQPQLRILGLCRCSIIISSVPEFAHCHRRPDSRPCDRPRAPSGMRFLHG
jgi:serine/threonine protein kinase